MSVDKFIVTHAPSSFTSLPNAPLQSGIDLAALGLWCSLASRPSEFYFYKDQIQSHFKIGRDKLLKLLSILKKHNLIEIQAIKNDKGQVEKWNLHIKDGIDFIHKPEKPYPGKTTILKNQSLENQGLVLAAYKEKKYKRNTKEKKKERAIKLKAPLSADFRINDQTISYIAAIEHLSGNEKHNEYKKFFEHYLNNGTVNADWNSVCRKWMLQAVTFKLKGK